METIIKYEIIKKLQEAQADIEQVVREIYYALSYLEDSNPARANLKQALNLLGIKSPREVGLGNSILTRNKKLHD
jgi:hypothetical protein